MDCAYCFVNHLSEDFQALCDIFKISKDDGYWVTLDERGRPYPCVEYEYSEEGFDNYTWLGDKMYSVSIWWFWFKRNIRYKVKGWWERNIAVKVPDDYEGF